MPNSVIIFIPTPPLWPYIKNILVSLSWVNKNTTCSIFKAYKDMLSGHVTYYSYELINLVSDFLEKALNEKPVVSS